jgi:hypothetical protein
MHSLDEQPLKKLKGHCNTICIFVWARERENKNIPIFYFTEGALNLITYFNEFESKSETIRYYAPYPSNRISVRSFDEKN